MLKFRFAGHLRRFFRTVTLNVETPLQGLRLLMAQNLDFKRALLKSRIRIRVAGDELTEENADWHMDRHLNDGATVLFVPVVEGGISAAVAVWIMVAVTVASVAYSLYMTHNMKNQNAADAHQANTITNNSFSSAENRVGQGNPVPILLGEMVVGSNVISLGIDTTNNKDWSESIS
ncbi:tail assembly protein [Escherichia coli]|nr:tail assembly protein [Escherichia coli]